MHVRPLSRVVRDRSVFHTALCIELMEKCNDLKSML